MGVTIEYRHPLTTWVMEHLELPIGKTNIPKRKEFPLAPIKKIVTLVLPSIFVGMISLHAYHQIQKHCAYPNYDATPNISEIGKQSPSLILGQPVCVCVSFALSIGLAFTHSRYQSYCSTLLVDLLVSF